ncbi:TRAP transporter small permease [Salinicola rhizosphaerae]|uniref:TRAP transporter small permease protein n=1 Tax=Salinicola rhizosphaerae TaxID=1443141 RepID=A0ABQ3DQW4_9GAMM|nr:TRAP transporter small permease [Salinicola rhizosphaerae]GHB11206.1 membrane protein [Salinicola rhizosphaerae]
MRRTLDALYLTSGVLAALFLMLIAVSILAQIAGRAMGGVIDATEFSGFCMAASTFLGLAYALRGGAHVRVGLLIEALPAHWRRRLESFVCAFSAGILGWLAWCAGTYTLQSYEFGDLSPGLIAAPLWIPQVGMTLGLIVMTIALVDEFWRLARHGHATYIDNDAGSLE